MDEVTAYIALGANLGDRYRTFRASLDAIDQLSRVRIRRVSMFYETRPVGGPADQDNYLNAVAEILTSLPPHELLDALHAIEARFGRCRTDEPRWGPRTCDLDILLMGNVVVEDENLTLPHPRMHERLFVLEPLVEIAPDAVHPRLGKTARQMLSDLEARN